jgi:putative hydrolase of the HAD superfamily
MNVVFDLGGVVVAWEPEEILARAFSDPDHRELAKREIIGHPDWLALDRGSMSFDEAIARGTERTGWPESVVRNLIESVPPSLVADPATVELLHKVKAAGNALYLLSNMPTSSMEHLERTYTFWHLFDGAVVSSRVGHCKPEPAIYEHLLNTYHLVPADTVFIDDVAANLHAARRFGIHPILFESAAQCEEELRALGCL